MRLLALLLALLAPALAAQRVSVGSKAFNEGVILGEVLTQTAREADAQVEHKARMGGTGVLWAALTNGDIDVYVDYTGTLQREVYATEAPADFAATLALMRRDGVQVLADIGFNNTYAIGMPEVLADKLGIRTISDLAKHPELKLGFSNEFMQLAGAECCLSPDSRRRHWP
jgi:osmoprotectant transport system permease protein